ncbi:hypothetical protein [Kangiella sp. TOML190]|uniref:hypothetical protein n=1 Tax=Kangiella sp. TOML190 TaxID=2931351 RepID=UPI00204190D6|nr:hypothetical protein [Kangiella sp. TOML190]
MRFFIRLFLFLIVIAALVYGYAWYKNKQSVDSMIINNGGSYDSTYLDLNGDSVIKGIRFNIPGLSDAATVQELRMGTGSLLTNVRVAKAFANQDLEGLPNHFDLLFDAKGAKLPLDPAMDQTNAGATPFLNLATFAGCGNRTDLSVADLSSLGIYALTSDAKVKVSIDKTNSKAFADFYINLDKLSTLKMDFRLDGFSFTNPFGMGLGGGSIEVSDNGIQRDINKLCAQESNLSEKQYTERHISYLKHLLFRENIYLSPEFYQTYAAYHANPRSIKLKFHPDSSLQPMSLAGVSPRRLMSLLNADVMINDQSITPLFGNRPDPSELPELDEVTPEESTLTIVQGLTVQPTAVASLANYVGYDAFFNYRGQKYKGEILSVSGDNALIKYEINAGNRVSKPFAISEIKNLRVRREFVPPKASSDN